MTEIKDANTSAHSALSIDCIVESFSQFHTTVSCSDMTGNECGAVVRITRRKNCVEIIREKIYFLLSNTEDNEKH